MYQKTEPFVKGDMVGGGFGGVPGFVAARVVGRIVYMEDMVYVEQEA